MPNDRRPWQLQNIVVVWIKIPAIIRRFQSQSLTTSTVVGPNSERGREGEGRKGEREIFLCCLRRWLLDRTEARHIAIERLENLATAFHMLARDELLSRFFVRRPGIWFHVGPRTETARPVSRVVM